MEGISTRLVGASPPSSPAWACSDSSFLLHAQRAGQKYGVPSSDILVELGRMKTVGGQEDMIEDVALNLRDAKQAETRQ